jgi:hypothetical protein
VSRDKRVGEGVDAVIDELKPASWRRPDLVGLEGSGGLRADPERLREASEQVRQAAQALRGFDPRRLDAAPREVGHTQLARALAASAAARREELAGLIDELDAVADHLRTTAAAIAALDQELARRTPTHNNTPAASGGWGGWPR